MVPIPTQPESEAYLLVLSDARRYIIETADPETAKRNFPVPGESVKVMSITPIMKREGLMTAHELAEVLAASGDKAPKSRTLLGWAQNGLIPYRRIGRKFVRFVEADVRKAMKGFERA